MNLDEELVIGIIGAGGIGSNLVSMLYPALQQGDLVDKVGDIRICIYDSDNVERKNLLNPGQKPEKSYVEKCLGKREGAIIAASDYIRAYADQIRPYISKSFYSFGTDGYGRSDGRKKLRRFFEVDKEHIVTYALSALAKEQLIPSKHAEKAMKKYNIDKNKPIPTVL